MSDIRIQQRRGVPGVPLNVSPFSLMRRMSEEMDRMFGAPILGATPDQGGWWPPIEVARRKDRIVVCAELPGLDKDAIRIEATDAGLVIEGEKSREVRHAEPPQDGVEVLQSERLYGRFYRLIPLPEGADVEHATAQFTDGVLTVEIPAPERGGSRPIPIR